MQNNWNVTFDIVTPESAADDDYGDCGFELENVSFREAIAHFGDYAECADSYPVDGNVRWFDSSYIQDMNGDHTRLSLHIPAQITPSSRCRLARYLGLTVR